MLQISNLNVYYGESYILRNVDLKIASGEMVCIIGRNGVGKTTLLKTIMGLLNPRDGQIHFAGNIINNQSPDQRAKMGIGYVPQGREIIPRLTVKANLLLGLEARKKRPNIVEYPQHPFFIACQFHPEFQSRPSHPHPLFKGFMEAAISHTHQTSTPLECKQQ